MCRKLEKETVIELHGWLSGPEVAEFGRTCDQEAQSIRIDLENLSGVSADGILALRDQQARGATLSGASPYIELRLRGPSTRDGGRGS
jgi:hypothetical protein